MTDDRSLRKNAVKAIVFGVALGFFVASLMTFLDWYENPGGIFHGDDGTNWVFVRDTFSSLVFSGSSASESIRPVRCIAVRMGEAPEIT